MVEPSWPTETVVARVRTDAATAVRIQDGVAESWGRRSRRNCRGG